MGPLADVQKSRDEGPNETLILRSKAHQLGLKADGSIEELRERIADHVRAALTQSPPAQLLGETQDGLVPDIIRERFTQPDPSATGEQKEAEEFVMAWETSDSASEVANKLDQSVHNVKKFAARLRSMGVELKRMPKPAIRYALSIRPSVN